MATDNKAMLNRVIAEVFNEEFVSMRVSSDEAHGTHSVQVNSRFSDDRTAIIRAGHVWMEAFIPELNVQTSILVDDGEVDDDPEDVIEAEKEARLRKICRVMHAYLEGGGHISERRSLLSRGVVRKLVIESDGFEWRLGRNSWSGPKPV
ncbi:hypothetical protein [Arthrobacter sp. SX1312]|uniref:hypothetical protein n=1 Tax=Arthrobacter sp. SX1312 TaxID=2058896 RepID=UPI000CE3AE88|nr:hypothetical protein [Arthrobacter sp. SX1312]